MEGDRGFKVELSDTSREFVILTSLPKVTVVLGLLACTHPQHWILWCRKFKRYLVAAWASDFTRDVSFTTIVGKEKTYKLVFPTFFFSRTSIILTTTTTTTFIALLPSPPPPPIRSWNYHYHPRPFLFHHYHHVHWKCHHLFQYHFNCSQRLRVTVAACRT